MPIRQLTYPMRFSPRGLVDALDSTDLFMGACINLRNLIFDQMNPEIMVSRPGLGSAVTTFTGFSTPAVISVFTVIGQRAYGMMASALNPGTDQPFSYDIVNNSFDTITGITAANSPTTPSSSGSWEPPTMAVVGSLIHVTHPGFSGSNRFGTIDITTIASPSWTAGDTTTNLLTGRPRAVANFNNRAYFAIGARLEYTDALSIVRTASSQALTMGGPDSLTGLSGLPIQTTSSGIVQALIAFKDFEVWQVTGDPTTSNLLQNYLSLSIGCSSPRSIASGPLGVYFASRYGPYIVDPLGLVKPVTYSNREESPDIQAPFQNMVEPTRVAGAYLNTIYRVCMETTIRGETFFGDYWFDERKRRWHGPHTFRYDCAGRYANYFLLCSNTYPARLMRSDSIPRSGNVYSDLSSALTVSLYSSTFPKTGHMTMKQVVESTQELSSAGAATAYAITAVNDGEDTLDSVSVTAQSSGVAWGSFVWGDGTVYTSATNRPRVYTVPWTRPLVFKKMALQITAPSNAALSIGTFNARFQDLGYTNIAP